MPVDAPIDGFAELCRLARAHRVPVVVDTSGPRCWPRSTRGPMCQAERARAGRGPPARRPGAGRKRARGHVRVGGGRLPRARGPGADLDAGTWVAHPGEVVHGNPTGAGDAVTAALARGLLHAPRLARRRRRRGRAVRGSRACDVRRRGGPATRRRPPRLGAARPAGPDGMTLARTADLLADAVARGSGRSPSTSSPSSTPRASWPRAGARRPTGACCS